MYYIVLGYQCKVSLRRGKDPLAMKETMRALVLGEPQRAPSL